MQPNEITLVVDENNDGTTTADADYVYRRFRSTDLKSEYIHTSNHAIDQRDVMTLLGTTAKRVGDFRGVNRTTVRFTKDVVVSGADGVSSFTTPLTTEIKMSIPVGASSAQILIERQKAIAILDNDTIMTALNELLET